ncbi:hypothetical protein GQ457_15G028710 [Hibiscus cannabinus]
MTNSSSLLFLHISAILMLCISFSSAAVEEDRKASIYIAYLGSLPDGDYIPTSHHFSLLQALFKQSSAENYLIRSYRRSFNGFAAKLTDEEAKKLASFKGVISVFPNKVYHLQTTRSWDFMGFNQTVKRNATAESNVVIGVIDTGIWPESDSFSDEGFGPPPQKWKGSCKGGQNFTCNNKLIGARVYVTDSARDTEGHGSHTASIAAGNHIENASFYGLAEGTARGGVPSARIAAYKVCNKGCTSQNILAAFDDAIADGVDILTVSLGSYFSTVFYVDAIAIGAFHAAEKGILVVQSAGNSGPVAQRVASVAPWMLSVAASTTDRFFIDRVVLGNGKTLTGFSVNSFSLNKTKVPLVYGLQASTECNETAARLACMHGCLNKSLVNNKIVLCDVKDGLDEAHAAGALGSITKTSLMNISFVVPLPSAALATDDYSSLISYQSSTKQPVAELLKSETIKDTSAPVVAVFSSRGPNFIVPDILKACISLKNPQLSLSNFPDLSAPGVNILAAYSPVVSPSSTATDERRVKYNILSGTSMACPHVAAVAAYVKTFHPHWSPSAIKSALITTASPMDPAKNSDAELAYGSGHVNPVKAINPGLVYDNAEGDNIRFLCSIGYSEDKIRKISGTNSSCPKTSTLPRNFNYPTLAALVKAGDSFTVNFQRTVTNVGLATSTYNATTSSSSNLEIKVIPQVLSFKTLGEKKSYNVTVKGKALAEQSMVSTSLTWSDGIHNVRSPIVIHTYEVMISAHAYSNKEKRNMANSCFLLFLHISAILMLCISFSSATVEEDRKASIYIAYLGSLPDGDYIPTSHHFSLLQALFKQSSAENYLIRSYRRSFNGFAAKLTDEEAKKLASFKGVVSVFPNKVYHLQTTRSWDSIKLLNAMLLPRAMSLSESLIVESGLIQTASVMKASVLLPKSGRDLARVDKTSHVTNSARDRVGHGSHTASTAAGNHVGNASFYGLAEGTARGGVPSARIAAYKVCDDTGHCTTENILAGFDDAIADGVDLLTVSIISFIPSELYDDPVSIGAFHAAEKGILVMQSAGNNGPVAQSVNSVAPWLLSVAASTTDRFFIDRVVLGNGKTLTGFSVNTFSINSTKVPLVYGLQASTECKEIAARLFPMTSCLNKSLVKNKIVVCDELVYGLPEARDAGALGTILRTPLQNISIVVPLPASALGTDDYSSLMSYLNSTKQAEAELLKTESIEDSSAPVVAIFSSRGPNIIVPDILKASISITNPQLSLGNFAFLIA